MYNRVTLRDLGCSVLSQKSLSLVLIRIMNCRAQRKVSGAGRGGGERKGAFRGRSVPGGPQRPAPSAPPSPSSWPGPPPSPGGGDAGSEVQGREGWRQGHRQEEEEEEEPRGQRCSTNGAGERVRGTQAAEEQRRLCVPG